jgi:hypothetical protein
MRCAARIHMRRTPAACLLAVALAACTSAWQPLAPEPVAQPSAPAPAVATAPEPKHAPQPVPEAPTRPAPASAWPAWTDRYRAVLELAWKHGVTHVASAGNAASFASDAGAWLCLFDAQEWRCFRWPSEIGRATSVSSWAYGAGSLEVEEGSVLHDLRFALRGQELELRHGSSAPLTSPTAGFDYTKPKPASSARPRRSALWKHGRPKLGESSAPAAAAFAGALRELFAAREARLARDEPAPDWQLFSLHHGGGALWTLTEFDDHAVIAEQWACHRAQDAVPKCLESRMARIRALAPDATLSHAWLLLADDPSYRGGSADLVWLDVAAEAPRAARLPVGRVESYGEACPDDDGYCVWMEGFDTPFELLAPPCVRVLPATVWSAVHVRKRRRFEERKQGPAPSNFEPQPGTYAPVDGAWQRADCGQSVGKLHRRVLGRSNRLRGAVLERPIHIGSARRVEEVVVLHAVLAVEEHAQRSPGEQPPCGEHDFELEPLRQPQQRRECHRREGHRGERRECRCTP